MNFRILKEYIEHSKEHSERKRLANYAYGARLGAHVGALSFPIFFLIGIAGMLCFPPAPVRFSQFYRPPPSLRSRLFSQIILHPVCEEIIYRFFLQEAVKKVSPEKKYFPIGLSSCLFSLSHTHADTKVTSLFFGMALGALKEATNGNMAPPIAMHMTHNALVYAINILQF